MRSEALANKRAQSTSGAWGCQAYVQNYYSPIKVQLSAREGVFVEALRVGGKSQIRLR
jgi:hypothetical protein